MLTLESPCGLERMLWIAVALRPFARWSNHGLRLGAQINRRHGAMEPN